MGGGEGGFTLDLKGKGKGSCHKREKGKPLATKGKREKAEGATKGKREKSGRQVSGSLSLGIGHRAHARTKRNDFPVGEALAALSPPNLRFPNDGGVMCIALQGCKTATISAMQG